jgi:ferredoxin
MERWKWFDMIRFTIDNREVEVPEGGSILEGAQKLGIDIPTLCYLECCGPMTSCLVCVVRVRHQGRTSVVPSCGMKAVDGMTVESETAEIHELRRTALELLLSEHVGDCLSPCSRICPLGLNIPAMLRQVQEERMTEAAATVRSALALPSVLGRLCHRPCENGCRRAVCDSAAAIQEVERCVADFNRAQERPWLPPCPTASGRRVAVVGAGPTGLAAAYALRRAGHEVRVYFRGSEPGGTLRREAASGALPAEVLAGECRDLAAMGVQFVPGFTVGRDRSLSDLQGEADAVLLALGETGPADPIREALEVAWTAAGVKIVAAESYLTSRTGVYAAGSVVRPLKQVVKAMAEGQFAAEAIDAQWKSGGAQRRAKPFSSVMGRLLPLEAGRFLAGASPAPRQVPAGGRGIGFTVREAASESSRCLHCDCRAAGNCKLQHYSQAYGAEFGRFPRQRRAFEQERHPGRVLFEDGKCIRCGICVHLAEQAAEPLGLTWVGRGFEVRVAAPWGESFEKGLQKVAAECAAACPTGAIVVDDVPNPSTAGREPGLNPAPVTGVG